MRKQCKDCESYFDQEYMHLSSSRYWLCSNCFDYLNKPIESKFLFDDKF